MSVNNKPVATRNRRATRQKKVQSRLRVDRSSHDLDYAGPVTIKRADGTVTIEDAYAPGAIAKVVGADKRNARKHTPRSEVVVVASAGLGA